MFAFRFIFLILNHKDFCVVRIDGKYLTLFYCVISLHRGRKVCCCKITDWFTLLAPDFSLMNEILLLLNWTHNSSHIGCALFVTTVRENSNRSTVTIVEVRGLASIDAARAHLRRQRTAPGSQLTHLGCRSMFVIFIYQTCIRWRCYMQNKSKDTRWQGTFFHIKQHRHPNSP